MGDQRGDTQAGTLLIVRANLTDLGARPVSPSWQSPDIYQQGGPITEVTVGVPVQLIALVSNFGSIDALAVRVTFWWADSGLGISKAAANPPIGDSALKTVMAGDSVEFMCNVPWVPEAVSASAHPCLVVEAAGGNCPVKQSFRPDLDTQVGQRNLTIKPPGGGQFKLKLFNPFADPASAVVFARSLKISGERVRELSDATLLDAGIQEMQRMLREQDIAVEEADSSQFLRYIDAGDIQERPQGERDDTSNLRAGVRSDHPQGEAIGELSLPAGGSATMVLEKHATGPLHAQAYVHQLIQVTDGFQTGGYSFVDR